MLLKFQNKILELIARGSSLEMTAEVLCLEAQAMAPGALCSILLVDHEGCLSPLSGPGLPQFYTKGITGLKIGPKVGSCGTAAYLRSDVSVTDIQSDPLWDDYRSLASRARLLACWSSPISDGNGRVLGTFAFYYREKRGPAAIEKAIVSACVNLCAIAIERDERVKERQRLAFTDELTSLGNRAAFVLKIEELALTSPRWGLLVVDIDNLKTVNDSFGHEAGDELIRVVARCIAAAAPACAFRLGGDEFAVLLPDVDGQSTSESASRILKSFRDPRGSDLVPKASIGGAEFGRDVCDAATVRRNADLALYHGKASGGDRFVAYEEGLVSDVASRMRISHELADALRHGRFDVLYDPLVDLETGDVVGLEAHCQARGADGALILTGSVGTHSDVRYRADVAMATLMIVQKDVEDWGTKGIAFEYIGFDLSLDTLRKESFRNRLFDAANAVRRQPTSLLLQLEEADLVAGIEDDLIRQMQCLRSKGVRIALDNFGSRDASLSALVSLCPQVLKIGSLFIDRLPCRGRTSGVLEAIVAVATKMDVMVVAEGLEGDEQIECLLKSGCRLGQGPLFGGPMTASHLSKVGRQKLPISLLVGVSAPTIVPLHLSDVQQPTRAHEAG